ncbi:hypothetical protein ACFFMR_19035 [Micromonospora andamanensis]|uniref:Uncharacterized protein n=1 Tax=Micromonospora andamanensis TaxID=1287068 RepID=A0ABQ4HYM3_9ACTN|nr:hypothetical protein [Micromonospora andamanensis]GIJ10763.1 hypothetical protein Van01_39770 [Micromonospora andamanensis]
MASLDHLLVTGVLLAAVGVAVLVIVLVDSRLDLRAARHDLAERERELAEARRTEIDLRAEVDLLNAACDRQTRRVEQLRDELDVLTRPGGAGLVAEMTAWLGELPGTDEREYPR